MWLCKRDLSIECEGKYRDCTDCVLNKIRAELIQSIQNGILKIESGNEELFRIIDKYMAEGSEKA